MTVKSENHADLVSFIGDVLLLMKTKRKKKIYMMSPLTMTATFSMNYTTIPYPVF